MAAAVHHQVEVEAQAAAEEDKMKEYKIKLKTMKLLKLILTLFIITAFCGCNDIKNTANWNKERTKFRFIVINYPVMKTNGLPDYTHTATIYCDSLNWVDYNTINVYIDNVQTEIHLTDTYSIITNKTYVSNKNEK